MEGIEVFFDGQFPEMCAGRLIIKKNGGEIYCKTNVVYSTGECHKLEDGSVDNVKGKLVWYPEEAAPFSTFVRDKVGSALKNFKACCGGCIQTKL